MANTLHYSTFREYLQTFATSGSDMADYGSYLNELESLNSFSHYSSTLVFLIDYKTMTYPFMAANVAEIIGHPKDAYLEGGLEFSFYNNQDFFYLNRDIFTDRASFLSEHKDQDLNQFRFSMGFRYKDAAGKIRHILQRNIITALNDQALPIGIMGYCWDVTNQTADPMIFHQIEQFDQDSKVWNIAIHKEYFPQIDEDKLLSKREIEILKWASEGLTSQMIAEQLFISVHTVNAHRKNMLRKTNSKNLMEVAQYAVKFKLL